MYYILIIAESIENILDHSSIFSCSVHRVDFCCSKVCVMKTLCVTSKISHFKKTYFFITMFVTLIVFSVSLTSTSEDDAQELCLSLQTVSLEFCHQVLHRLTLRVCSIKQKKFLALITIPQFSKAEALQMLQNPVLKNCLACTHFGSFPTF